MDENEFADRIEKLRSSLYRTAYLYLGSETATLDAVDEAVYKALISLKKLRRPEYFDTWITRILINECKNELRHRKREISVDSLPEKAVEQFDALPLRDAVLRLPKDLKEPIILRYFAGLTTEETAGVLNLKQGTAASRLRRALKLLRLELTEEDNENEPKQRI